MLIRLALAAFAIAGPATAAEWQTISGGFAAPQAFGFSTGAAQAQNAVASRLFAAPALPGGFASPAFAGGSLFNSGTSARYADRINDTWLFGIETSSGFANASPFATSYSTFRGQPFGGLAYNSTSVRLGYDLGGLTPYVTSSVTQAKPDFGFGGAGTQFEQGILAQNPSYSARTAASVGAGFNYSLGANTSINLGVSVGNGAPGLLGQ